ncbi:8-oxoguanine deaminase [Hartmannibacter diazotrophicus]|uniref:8-oxoguanine deaminase n=1 Tax=Hartmannibacter diazotrophicus TaxID=1482074 RepID=A0A2C9D122_9HYPH|nr:amidohydrolase family protein [Hartmannibacter diazotrophicus]SON53923.1 8-oxoguanine deaminase [Hartmannibacter diazotrophicus]
MTVKDSCIVEAGTLLVGVGPDGAMERRYDVGIRVHEGLIAQVGAIEAVAYGNDHLPRYGSRGMIAMPGLVNGHHHFGLTPLMMGVPFAPLELWLPRFRAMRQIGNRLDTLYSAIEMLESGTTTVHHIQSGLTGTPDNWHAITSDILGAYDEIGMRAGYSFMMRDQNILAYEDDAKVLAALPEKVRDWLAPKLGAAATPTADYMDFFRAIRSGWAETSPDGVRVNLAPANLHWCSDESLQLMSQTAREAGASIHMHLVETERQAEYALKKFGHTAVQHLQKLECLGPEVTLGHGNWMTPEDLDIIAGCGCTMCHNASSGLRLGSGIAPVNEMRARQIPVALGIDQSNLADDRDMTLEMKLVWALHRETGLFNDRPDAAAVLQMATEHGAKSAGFGGLVGRVEPGLKADIVLMDEKAMARPFVSKRTPVEETVLHRGGRHAIDKVFVGGRLVVDGGKVISIDREAVMAEVAARLEAPETAAEAADWEMVNAMMPHLEAFHRDHPLVGERRPYRFNRITP